MNYLAITEQDFLNRWSSSEQKLFVSEIIWKSDFNDFPNLQTKLENLFLDKSIFVISKINFLIVIGSKHIIDFLYE